MHTLQTARTVFRRFQASDLGKMVRLESDPAVMRFTPSRVPQPVEKTEARLRSLIEKQAAYAPLGVWAVEHKETGEFIGWFMLLKTEFSVPELGFMIVRDRWGQGYATEAAQALIEFGTKELKYPGIAAVTDHNNSASIRVLEKLGFTKVSSRVRPDKVLGRDLEAHIFELRSQDVRN